MKEIKEILELAARLPSGIPDYRAVQKLSVEQEELKTAIVDDDHLGALTELADVVYYAVKAIHAAASMCGMDVDAAMDMCIAKYRLRARPGNPKNDAEERAAVLQMR